MTTKTTCRHVWKDFGDDNHEELICEKCYAHFVPEKVVPQMTPYPDWICSNCGDRYGNRPCGIATWHPNKCDICGCETDVTEPRDFGHLKDGWQHADK